jgi:hypothetical protein
MSGQRQTDSSIHSPALTFYLRYLPIFPIQKRKQGD